MGVFDNIFNGGGGATLGVGNRLLNGVLGPSGLGGTLPSTAQFGQAAPQPQFDQSVATSNSGNPAVGPITGPVTPPFLPSGPTAGVPASAPVSGSASASSKPFIDQLLKALKVR